MFLHSDISINMALLEQLRENMLPFNHTKISFFGHQWPQHFILNIDRRENIGAVKDCFINLSQEIRKRKSSLNCYQDNSLPLYFFICLWPFISWSLPCVDLCNCASSFWFIKDIAARGNYLHMEIGRKLGVTKRLLYTLWWHECKYINSYWTNVRYQLEWVVSRAGHNPEFHEVEEALRGRKWCQITCF